MRSKPLSGQTAIVLGGTAGVGLATAELLVHDGARVMIVGRRVELLSAARDKLLETCPGGQVETFSGDATTEVDVRMALQTAFELQQRLDIVITVVGGSHFRPFLTHDLATFQEDLDRNLLSAFLAIRYGAPLIAKGGRGGSIVCVSTAAATTPLRYSSTYCAAKGALEQLVRTVAIELAAARIRVNCVRPGFTRTDATQGMFADQDTMDRFLERIPFGRCGEAHEVAAALRFMAGPESGYITGQSFAVDGGIEQCGQPDLTKALLSVYGEHALERLKAGFALDD